MVMVYGQPNSNANPISTTGLSLSASIALRHRIAEQDTRVRQAGVCQETTLSLASAAAVMPIAQYKFDNHKKSRSRDNLKVNSVD